MARLHLVAQGEHASGIAEQYGFGSFDVIWQHAENKALRDKRKDPNVLLPGDEIYIPDAQLKQLTVPSEKRHTIVVHRPKAKLRLVLLDALGDPIANVKGDLTLKSEKKPVTTDGEGLIEVEIPLSEKTAVLEVEGLVYDLAIGHLDPENTATGADSRLVNLGYRFVEPEDLRDDGRRAELIFAAELFAHDHDVKPQKGQYQAVLDKLRQTHGC
jgi:N-acetylmuramoyl-L-alanine amidase